MKRWISKEWQLLGFHFYKTDTHASMSVCKQQARSDSTQSIPSGLQVALTVVYCWGLWVALHGGQVPLVLQKMAFPFQEPSVASQREKHQGLRARRSTSFVLLPFSCNLLSARMEYFYIRRQYENLKDWDTAHYSSRSLTAVDLWLHGSRSLSTPHLAQCRAEPAVRHPGFSPPTQGPLTPTCTPLVPSWASSHAPCQRSI